MNPIALADAEKRERAIYDASKRISAAKDKLKEIGKLVDSPMPLPMAGACTAGISEHLGGISCQLAEALSFLDAEIDRIEAEAKLEE